MSRGVIDCDVHPHVNGGLAAVFPYLDEGRRRRLESRKDADPFFAGGPNLIFEGALSRFERLKFVLLESGWTWLPSQLWRMDEAWRSGRVGSPWVAKPPSEYVFERIRFGSEPAGEVLTPAYLETVLEAMHAEQTLLFTSDYPHWDMDSPATVFTKIDGALRQRILRDNAIETFGPRLAAPQRALVQ